MDRVRQHEVEVSAIELATRPRAAATGMAGRRVVLLAGAGVAILAALLGFTLLYVNVPAGYNVPYGLSLASPPLFRALWPYPSLSLDPGAFKLLALLAILAMWAIYLAAAVAVQRAKPVGMRRRMAYVIAAFAVLYNVMLAVAMPPVLSADVYHYALFGRMVSFYGLNPYVTPGSAIAGDPLWSLAYWRDVTTHYGPVWTLLSAWTAAIGGQGVLPTIIAFKGLAALLNLANGLLVFLLARRLTGGEGVGALLLYAWNPLILIETAGSGHNDAAMMTFALLGLLLATRGRVVAGFAILLLSAMVKYLTGLLALLFAVHYLARARRGHNVLALAAGMAGLGGALLIALYLPFWAGVEGLERLAGVGAPFKTVVRFLLREGVASLLAGGGDTSRIQETAEGYVTWGLYLGFGVLVVLLAKAAASRKASLPRVLELWGTGALLYIVPVYGWNYPWYLIPILTTTFVCPPTRWNRQLLAWAMAIGVALTMLYTVLVAV